MIKKICKVCKIERLSRRFSKGFDICNGCRIEFRERAFIKHCSVCERPLILTSGRPFGVLGSACTDCAKDSSYAS